MLQRRGWDPGRESCWRRGGPRLSLVTGPKQPAVTKESVMDLQPVLARALLATVSILLLLAGVAAMR